MLELNKSQIAHLERFLVQHYVRYKDVQLELMDHLASAIEEKMKENEELSFESALDQVYKGFGVSGFAKIVKEKEKAMNKFWLKHFWSSLIQFLKPPLLFLTIGIYGLLWSIQMYFKVYFFNAAGILTICGLFVVLVLCFKLYSRKNEYGDMLFLSSYNGFAFFLLYLIIYLPPSSFLNFLTGESSITFSNHSVAFGSAYLTFSIIVIYILAIKIPSGLLAKMKSEYKEYLLT